MLIKFKKTNPAARVPHYASAGAACFDLCSVIDTLVHPGTTMLVSTGLAFEVPEGNALLVYPRSGLAMRGLRLANCVGVVDSDYRGDILVALHNDSREAMLVRAGDRIAQAMIVPAARHGFVESKDLSSTERGAGGFGSTGVA